MRITAHDIGRIAIDREGDRWEILSTMTDDQTFTILARHIQPLEMIEATFLPDGHYGIAHEDDWDLIAWEDEVAEERK